MATDGARIGIGRLYLALVLPALLLVELALVLASRVDLYEGAFWPAWDLLGGLDVRFFVDDGVLHAPWPSVVLALGVALVLTVVVRATIGPDAEARAVSLAGQYELLLVCSLVVLGPIFLTVIQALSPPFRYVNAGTPLHPVEVAWKDRTWWTGGPVSVVGRTVAVVLILAVLQRVGTELRLRDARFWTPARLVAVVGGTVVLGFATIPVFTSLRDASGGTALAWLVAAVLVAATQVWAYAARGRSLALALFQATLTGLFVTSLAVVAAGPQVWTVTWSRFELGDAMTRSLIMAVLITSMQVITSITSAYAFVFLEFPFKRILFALFMATLLLPLEVTLVANVATIRQLEWINTMQALVLPFGATALGTFLIRQGFRGLPPEIQDATRLDGYGHLSFLTKFAVPLTRPVIASFTVISALQAWNQYLWPRSVISENEFNTLQIQLRAVAAGEVARANEAVAAALVAAVPVVVLLIVFQKQIIRGLTAGAVK